LFVSLAAELDAADPIVLQSSLTTDATAGATTDAGADESADESADAVSVPECEENVQSKLPAALEDALFALLLVAVGFFFWEWSVIASPFGRSVGIGATLIFLVPLVAAYFYLRRKGFRTTRKSLCAFAVAVMGTLPFMLYGARDINAILIVFEFLAVVLWVAYTCRTTLKQFLSGLVIIDICRQVFVVPFVHCLELFASLGFFFRGKPALGIAKNLLLVCAGIVVFIPVLLIVLGLLTFADSGFYELISNLDKFFSTLDGNEYIRYFNQFLLGIPLACYIFGAIYGNYKHSSVYARLAAKNECAAQTSKVSKISKAAYAAEACVHTSHAQRAMRAERRIEKLHALPRLALYAPLACLVLIYIVFFMAMGSYVFSAWHGTVPTAFTYAEYARKGFVELCQVSFLNLVVLVVVYLFSARSATGRPRVLRVLAGLICALTCLLIATALSKMYLYVQAYGLTPLRLYSSWFMVVLLLVFLLLLAWHVRSFNVARPLIVGVTVLVLALGLANTDGIIAQYNVERYMTGKTQTIDVNMLDDLFPAAAPALYELKEYAPDAGVRDSAAHKIERYSYTRDETTRLFGPYGDEGWYYWNLQLYGAQRLEAQSSL
jgi:hypothetical protein